MVNTRKKIMAIKKGSGKKTLKAVRRLKNRRIKNNMTKGKKRSAILKKRLGGASALKRKGGPFRLGYEQGYREGHAKGFEDAHQEAYMTNTGTENPAAVV
ncbi:hypothetical protein [Paenibacillus arenilitoris]|uniref:Uncharacterized protein n=1 Tax=Paenibacillus arenilitoris TaxID=2772299 RepID=A0A927CNW6_9BACL|nr:hypothetical protein [Paenibacillus arenilitoris]MBD2871528.1 hypothetical protein [Paenibacillus arenilitoris]